MDIASGLTAVGQAISITKSLRELEKSYDAVVHKAKVVDLMEALVETKAALADAKTALEEKDRELASMRGAFMERAELVRGDGDYKFRTDADGNKVGYPACPKCEVTSGKIVQLKQDGRHYSGKCPVCDASFSPVTCYLPKTEVRGEIDTVAKRVAESQRQSMERAARLNRQSSWIDSRY